MAVLGVTAKTWFLSSALNFAGKSDADVSDVVRIDERGHR